ncbi:MAG: VOC family protein [Thermodesulfobacteriota bacterium]
MELKFNRDHIHIRCQDFDGAVAWYENVLCAKVVTRGEVPGMPIVRLDLGGEIIALSPKREGMEVEPLSGRPRWGCWQIAFNVTDLEQTYLELKARGAEFEIAPFQQTPQWKAAFLKAPDGVQVELIQYT